MFILIFLLSLFSSPIFIPIPTSAFDYEEYDQLAHVVEGELISKWDDSLSFRVTEVWTGSSELGDELTLTKRFRMNVEQGDKALFLVDSAGTLQCYGLLRDGFYIMVGRTSPNILTVDDLYLLSRGEEPEFNTHESRITVHFPLSSEEIDIRVIPSENGRRTSSSYSKWNDLDPSGGICSGDNYLTEFCMIPSGEDLYQGVQLGSYAGDVQKYSDGVFYIDVWPDYPCFASIQNMHDFYENGSIPVYIFRIDMVNEDYWSIGLSDEAFMVSDGMEFYLRGRQKFVPEDSRRNLDNFSLFFRTFASGGSSYSRRSTLLRINDLDQELKRPLLATMLEELRDKPISGTLYFVESDDSEPERYSNCTISLYTPIFEIAATCDTTLDDGINGAILSFNDIGRAILEYGDRTYPQIHLNLESPHPYYFPPIRQYTYAAFDYPVYEDFYLLLHFSSVRQSTYIDGADDMLITGLIHHWLRVNSIEGIIYKFDRTNFEIEQVGSFSMSMI